MLEDLKQIDIRFNELVVDKSYGNQIFRIWFVVENERCKVLDSLEKIPKNKYDKIVDIISKMATLHNFKNPSLKRNLKGYGFGEVKPWGHRFFFFIKMGNNIVFFDYYKKNVDSLGDKIYKNIDQKRRKYEEEFIKYFRQNQ